MYVASAPMAADACPPRTADGTGRPSTAAGATRSVPGARDVMPARTSLEPHRDTKAVPVDVPRSRQTLVTVGLRTTTGVTSVTSAPEARRTIVSTCHHVFTERQRPETSVGSDRTLVGTKPGTTRWGRVNLGKVLLPAAARHAAPKLTARKYSV